MPVVKCKEKEGQADACTCDIVYSEAVHIIITASPTGGRAALAEGAGNNPIYLTLQCLNGHIHNYEIK